MIAWLLAACFTTAPDPCATAWAEHAALTEGLRSVAGASVRALDEASFRAWCEALPADARACLAPTHATVTPACAERLSDLPVPPRLDAPPTPD